MRVSSSALMVGDVALTGGDELPEDYIAPQGFNVTLNVEQAAGAERIFAALSKSGTVTVPLQETFWAVRYGMMTDQFDIPWMINCERAVLIPSATCDGEIPFKGCGMKRSDKI